MRSPAAVFALGLLVTYGWFHHQGGFSQNARFDLTRAIVEQGTLRIDAYHGNTLDKAVRDGHYYCDKPPLPSLLGVPAYFVFVRTLAGLGRDPTTPRAQAVGFWLARMTAVSLFGCALAVVFLRVVGHHADAGLPAAVGLGLGTLVFPYSTVFYGHVVAAALLFFAFAVLLADRRDAAARAPALAAAGLAAGSAVAAEYQVVLLVGLLGLYALSGEQPVRTAAWFAAGLAVPVAGLMAYHTAVFGGPFSTGFAHEALPYWQTKYASGFYGIGLPKPAALWQLTFGGYRGLFRQAPWLLLAAPGAVALVRRGWWPEAALAVAAFAVMLALNASLHSWEGGWTMGARYLVPAVPFLAFAATFATGRRTAAVATALIAVSVFVMLTGAAVMPEVPIFFLDPLTMFLLPRFFAGGFPVPNPQGAAWNLGQLAGLPGLWSLAPLVVLWAGAGAALGRRLRGSR
jgi:hypothetical protein